MKTPLMTLACIALATILGTGPTPDPTPNALERYEAGPWTFTILLPPDANQRVAEIRLDGEVVWHGRGSYMSWGFDDANGQRRGIGDDITNDGRPEAVLSNNGGDPRGRNTVHLVFDLNALRHMPARQRVQELGNGRFQDRDGDGAFEFYERESIHDPRVRLVLNVWSQWPEICYTPHTRSGARGAGYSIDIDRTRGPALDAQELASLIERYNVPWDGDSPQNLLIGSAVEVFLSILARGHPRQAWQFWHGIRPAIEAIWGFDETTADLRKLIDTGPYAPLLDTPAILSL